MNIWRWLQNLLSWWFLRDVAVESYHLEFAVRSQYDHRLIWFNRVETSWPLIIRLVFDALRCCEPQTLTVNGRNLYQLNLLIPTSPEFGTHIHDSKNPNPILRTIEEQKAAASTSRQI